MMIVLIIERSTLETNHSNDACWTKIALSRMSCKQLKAMFEADKAN